MGMAQILPGNQAPTLHLEACSDAALGTERERGWGLTAAH